MNTSGNGAGKHLPLTVHQLVPLLETRFHELRTQVCTLAGTLAEVKHRDSREPVLRATPAVATVSLRAVITELARSQLLSGRAERFDPTIREVIKYYCFALQAIREVTEDKGLGKTRQESYIATLTMFLERDRLLLELAGVDIEPVQPGTPLVLGRHKVAKSCETGDGSLVGKVADSLSPFFSWPNANGGTSQVAAEVVVFVANETPVSQRQGHTSAKSTKSTPRKKPR